MKRLGSLIVLFSIFASLLAACSTGAGVAPPDNAAMGNAPAASAAPAAAMGGTSPAAAASTAPAASAADSGNTLKIGVVTDLSKALSLYGKQEVNGFNLGLQYATNGTMEVAGRKLEVIVRDDEANADKARQLARELIERDGVEVLQCCASTTSALGGIEVAKDNQKVAIIDPAAGPQITGANFNKYVFRTGRNNALSRARRARRDDAGAL